MSAPKEAITRAIGEIQVRRAAPSEVIDVRHAVLRAGRPRSTAFFSGDDHAHTRHWIAKAGDDIIGVVSTMAADFPSPNELPPDQPIPRRQLRGMATLPTWRGKGIGRSLLSALEQETAEPIWCNARESAVGFYERNGWQVVGEPFEIDPIGTHFKMVKFVPSQLGEQTA